jgi:hypothetical protein
MFVGAVGVGWWIFYATVHGASHYGDSRSYVAFADALENGRIPASERTPIYPVVVLGSRFVATTCHVVPEQVLVMLQTLLLAGLCPVLLYDLGRRLTDSTAVARLAAALFLADADVQSFGTAVMSEGIATPLAIGTVWLAVRDGGWRRAGWLCALLVATRPAYLLVPPTFACIEAVRARRLTAAVPPLAPTLVLAVLWGAVGVVAGARPSMPFSTFGPLHSFAKVYEFDLWKALPDGDERRIIGEERAARHDVYAAAARLRAELGESAVSDVADRVARTTPLRLASRMLGALPAAFHQPSLWKPNHRQPRVFAALVQWHRWYRDALYEARSRFRLFVVLLVIATVTGFGWAPAATGFRTVITPFVVERLVSTALLAMGTDQVGRLAMAFRPFYCLAIALACVRFALSTRAVLHARAAVGWDGTPSRPRRRPWTSPTGQR